MIEGMTCAADFDSKPPPSFVRRLPEDDTLEGARFWLASTDRRIAWLAQRGLRPHPNVIERRAELLEKIARFERDSGA